jgi:hypothetical protein
MESIMIPMVITLLPLLTMLAILYAVKYRVKRQRRRSPLCSKLLRSPGESLRIQIDDSTQDLTSYLLFMPLCALVVYSIHVSQLYYGGKPETVFGILISVLTTFAFFTYFSIKFVKLLNLRRRLRLAHDAEMAVAQELNHLMLDGYHVYHDFPAERFNIDHIAVGPAGAFAIETKARTKPTTGNGKSDAEVVYDGQCLKFPAWSETKPIEQAASQAEWLGRWLSSAVGESLRVEPVLTLPGWFVRRTSPNGILVLNPKNLRPVLKNKRGAALSDNLVRRIVHQLDHRCRDVEPKAYWPDANRV